MVEKDRLKILSIESSCDESGLAVIEDGREIIFNSLASQADIHARFGGIVPEIASRQHLLTFPKLLKDYIENSAHIITLMLFPLHMALDLRDLC